MWKYPMRKCLWNSEKWLKINEHFRVGYLRSQFTIKLNSISLFNLHYQKFRNSDSQEKTKIVLTQESPKFILIISYVWILFLCLLFFFFSQAVKSLFNFSTEVCLYWKLSKQSDDSI